MTTYTLGPLRLSTQDNLLFCGAEPLTLGQRAIALLRALVERPGAVVSKEALIAAAWPGQAVEESNLTVQIATLRRVLGEATGGGRWIVTMPVAMPIRQRVVPSAPDPTVLTAAHNSSPARTACSASCSCAAG